MKHVAYGVLALMLSGLAGTVAAEDLRQPLPPKQLDLRAPDITKLYTPEQLNVMLAQGRNDSIEEIEVEAARTKVPPPRSPEVWTGLAAPVWALLHPVQAWRIFVPVPPDRAQILVAGGPPDFTTGYLQPAAVPPPSY